MDDSIRLVLEILAALLAVVIIFSVIILSLDIVKLTFNKIYRRYIKNEKE